MEIWDLHVNDLPWLGKMAAITRNHAFRDLKMDDISFNLRWTKSDCQFEDLSIDAHDMLAICGSIRLHQGQLNGRLRVGTTRKNLEWLPDLEKEVFRLGKKDYYWADVQLSGTIDQPKQDLVPRIKEVLMRHPIAALGVLIRQLGED